MLVMMRFHAGDMIFTASIDFGIYRIYRHDTSRKEGWLCVAASPADSLPLPRRTAGEMRRHYINGEYI